MTPKDKAKELYDKFSYLLPDAVEISKQDIQALSMFVTDEIINVAPSDKSIFGNDYLTLKEYWQRVKQEINNL